MEIAKTFFFTYTNCQLIVSKNRYFITTECIQIITPILRIGDQVLTFDVFWPKHLQEVRSTVYIHVQSI